MAETSVQHLVRDAAHRGTLDIRTTAMEHLVQHVASEVPGTMRYRSGLDRLRGRGYPHAEVDVRGSAIWVRLEVAVRWPTPVEDIAVQARERVRSETMRLSGSEVRRVDVSVHMLCADQVDTTQRRVL